MGDAKQGAVTGSETAARRVIVSGDVTDGLESGADAEAGRFRDCLERR